MIVYAFLNMKGGVGKTTLALNMAELFALRGYRVLFVDMDGQGSSTAIWKVPFRNGSMVDILKGDKRVADVAVPVMDNLDLLPSHGDLFMVDFDAEGDRALVRALAGVTKYDLCIIDCPPALGVLSLMALACADEIVIPVTPSIIDVNALVDFIKKLKARNQTSSILGIILTRTDPRRRIDKQARATLKRIAAVGIPVMPFEVPEAAVMVESVAPDPETGKAGTSVFRYKSRDRRRQEQVAKSLERIGMEMVKCLTK